MASGMVRGEHWRNVGKTGEGNLFTDTALHEDTEKYGRTRDQLPYMKTLKSMEGLETYCPT